ncbi:MAG: sigma 54-interacting transcriptional regulator [Tissierellaceae bacterium]|nr:sigma 54-interacting transcriptional regulator [Tissierellaceae bacterium]
MKTRRIKISTSIDRPHITYDILTILHNHNINILAMEVYAYVIYLKIPIIDQELWKQVLKEMQDIEGFDNAQEIDLIAFEERDIEMKRVLDIVPQGVVVLNAKGAIKYANNYVAQRILKTTSNVLANRSITDFIDDDKVKNFLSGIEKLKSIRNQEITIGNQIYILNIHPILSDENIFSGYMLSLTEVINQDIYHNPITFNDIIGESYKLQEVIEQAKLFALADSPVMITGESGTGKELFARAIHNDSYRNDKPFIAINCAAIPDQLLESELFGYEGGSFTGGKKEGKKGIFELGEGGTIFLDEIGEMAPHLQSKLLRVLQEKSVRRIGSHKEAPIDVRIITATNQNIDELVATEKFRLDLLYRINIFSIEIPPLRNRKEDIPILVEHFTGNHVRRYGKSIEGLEPKAMKKLISYNWPGNIRELQNVLERAIALTPDNMIKEKDIMLNYKLERSENLSDKSSLNEIIGHYERNIILDTLKNCSSIREASRKLDVTHTLLINRIKKYNIQDEEWKY